MFTAYHAKYYAYALTLRHGSDGVDRLSQSLFDAGVDLNPHQIDAALVLSQYWVECKRRLLIICQASLRKLRHGQRKQGQEIFAIEGQISEQRDA